MKEKVSLGLISSFGLSFSNQEIYSSCLSFPTRRKNRGRLIEFWQNLTPFSIPETYKSGRYLSAISKQLDGDLFSFI